MRLKDIRNFRAAFHVRKFQEILNLCSGDSKSRQIPRNLVLERFFLDGIRGYAFELGLPYEVSLPKGITWRDRKPFRHEKPLQIIFHHPIINGGRGQVLPDSAGCRDSTIGGGTVQILVSNDDGIFSKGIVALSEALIEFGAVTVVAPNRERSAASHSLTLDRPLRTTEVEFPVAVKKAISVNGTPSDCVKLGLSSLLDSPADLIVAGINRGANMNVDVFYSGTIAAAFEGVLSGIPAIAFSLAHFAPDSDFSVARGWARTCVERILASGTESGFVYNVNIPYLPKDQIKGLRVTHLASVRYRDSYELRHDPSGKPYYWIRGEQVILDQDPDSDIMAVRQGYVSLTPIRVEMTDFQAIEKLREKGFSDSV